MFVDYGVGDVVFMSVVVFIIVIAIVVFFVVVLLNTNAFLHGQDA